MYIKIDQPEAAAEKKILRLVRRELDEEAIAPAAEEPSLDAEDILEARKAALKVHMSEAVEEYLVQLIMATRLLKSMMPKWPVTLCSASQSARDAGS